MRKLLIIAIVIALAYAQPQPFGTFSLQTNGVSQYYSDFRQAVTYKKGLTFEATIFPE